MDSMIVFAEDLPDSTIHDRVERGALSRIARGIYTSDMKSEPMDVVRRSWREIIARRFPDAVVTDRSAKWAQPHDGYLFLASTRDATLELPGLTVVSRKGAGPIQGDIAMGAGVHLASRPRALLDNTRPTRKRGSRPPAALTCAELADWIDHLCAVDGPTAVSAYRDTAESLADALHAADEFVEQLKDWHRVILGDRPDTRPDTRSGELKRYPNQAGNTVFVPPDLVEGTLRRGYGILQTLTTPTQRGGFVAFVVAEVHPFDDGNGRLARAVMNAEYVAGDEQRAVIPTISRNDYLRALRRLSRQDKPDLFVTYLDRIRRWTTRMNWSTIDGAREELERSNFEAESITHCLRHGHLTLGCELRCRVHTRSRPGPPITPTGSVPDGSS